MISPDNAQQGESRHRRSCHRSLIGLHHFARVGQSESLRRHCYAVADSLRHFAPASSGDPDLWEAVGLLHDMDYERNPNLERSSTDGHPFVAATWLREHGWSEEVCRPSSRTRIRRRRADHPA